MTMKKTIYILSILLLASSLLFAGYTYEDLEKSMQLNSTKLKSAVEEYNRSKLDTKDAKANYQPTIDATLMGAYIINPIDEITVATPSTMTSLGPLLSGLAHTQVNIPDEMTIETGMNNLYYGAGITVKQPIFTWGKITNAVRAYSEIEKLRQLQIGDTEEQLKAELKTRLSAEVRLREILSLLEKTNEHSSKLVSLSEQAYEKGAITELDYKGAEVDALEVDANLAKIKSERENNLTAIRALTGIYDLEGDDIEFTEDEAYLQSLLETPKAELEAKALSQSKSTLSMLKHYENAMEYKRKVASSDFYGKPDIALMVGLGYGGKRFPLFEDGWTDDDHGHGIITIGLSTTLWDGGKILNDIKRNKSQVESAKINYTEAENTIRTTLSENLTNMQIASSRIKYLDLTIEHLEAEAEQAEKKVELGSASTTDYLKSLIELDKKRLERCQEQLTYSSSGYIIAYLTETSIS